MKTRADFVSNSSSSSFIMRGDDAKAGLKLLKAVAADHGIPWRIGEDLEIRLYARNKNVKKLRQKLEDASLESGWSKSGEGLDPESTSYCYSSISMSSASLEALDDEALDMVEDALFYLDDGQYDFMPVFKMLYLFFERTGCCPDPSFSEQNFLSQCEEEEFMSALAGNEYVRGGKGEERGNG